MTWSTTSNWRRQQNAIVCKGCSLTIVGDQVEVVGPTGLKTRFGPDRIGSFQQLEAAFKQVGGGEPSQLELVQLADWALFRTSQR